ncbi:bifunctional transcriptional activator/DNA repair enzyme AdaA [Halodesulfovibrio spirochaetisodalis]|uniref:HTH araC/xylS-type domain-containing protein n=1 Tax=Halodesulfovibrio spirochaetisodalis TaxID=1560234 RepID=A0A1B7X9K5_9BACT|nr:methylated-DNA--[protein]-cysteine S-methyltransferase [Halodesulfovibrio spirochaetisodalis]OBQ45980.1 hypothetical protein SP90_14880 [Halodesulfovibrio spirochaetisodalis]
MARIEQHNIVYRRIEAAIHYIEEHAQEQPGLDDIAAHVHLSKHHFARLFKEWVGVSPIQFLHFITVEYTKERLAEQQSILDAAHSAGLSGPGRLHDLFVNFEGMTPGEYKQRGKELTITYDFASSPFGECLLATTTRGICYLGFVGQSQDHQFAELKSTWPGACFVRSSDAIAPIMRSIFYPQGSTGKKLTLLLKGTNFQINVWRALLTIPAGHLATYKDIATLLGTPKASRAVGNAIAVNPVGYLIPCHRAITSTGAIKKYRWGSTRKKALIGWEASKRELAQESSSL